jgi:hypothetical protein
MAIKATTGNAAARPICRQIGNAAGRKGKDAGTGDYARLVVGTPLAAAKPSPAAGPALRQST